MALFKYEKISAEELDELDDFENMKFPEQSKLFRTDTPKEDRIAPQEQKPETSGNIIPGSLEEAGQRLVEGPSAARAGIAHGAKNVLRGAAQSAAGAAEWAGMISPETEREIKSSLQQSKREEEQELSERGEFFETGAKLGSGGMEIAVGALGPGKFKGILGSIWAGAKGGAAYEATQVMDPDVSRVRAIAEGAVSGAAAGTLLHSVALGGRGIAKAMGSKRAAASEYLLYDKELTRPQAVKAGEAARRILGDEAFLTPAERGKHAVLAGREKSILGTEEGTKAAIDRLGDRDKLVYQNAKQLVDDMFPEGKKAARKATDRLYKQAYPKAVPAKQYNELMEDEIIADVKRKVYKNPKMRPKNVALGSVEELDLIKRAIDDDIALKEATLMKKAKSSTEYQNLLDAKDKLIKVADNISPEYQAARALSSRIKVSDQLDEVYKKAKLKPREGEPSIKELYKAFVETPQKREDFLTAIVDGAGNTQQARDLVTIIDSIAATPIPEQVAGSTLAPTKFAVRQADKSIIGELIHSFYSGRKGDTLLDLSTDPKFAEILNDVIKIRDIGERARAFSGLVGSLVAPKQDTE